MKKVIFSISIVALLMSGCYKDDIDDLKGKYDDLKTEQERQAQLLATVQNALQNQLTVTSYTQISGGYRITFSDGNSIDLLQGQTPVIEIGANGNWRINGADVGVKAEGVNGTNGIDGQPGQTPKVEIVGGYWYINDVNTGTKAEGTNGTNGTNGTSGKDAPAITSIVIQGGNMVFTFNEGSPITIPMSGNLICSIVGATVQYFECGESREFTITQSGVQNIAIAKPDGWKVSMNGNKMTVMAPAAANEYAERSGILSIVATGSNATAIASMEVHARDYNYLIDFEAARILDYLAGPTSYGDNLYSSYTGANRYYGYDDASTGLMMMINDQYDTGDPDFWNGGIAISQWNDMTAEGYFNQCSVYSRDVVTTFGGYNGSKTFAVATGYNDPMFMGDGRSIISFYDNLTECTFDHFWVTNSTYAALSMMNGDGWIAKKFSYADKDWLKIVIEAFDKNDVETGATVEFYLADFRTATSPGIITEWKMVDLTPLGNKVHAVKFDIQSSDTGSYGMNTPAYFCFDNLAIKK